MISLCNVSMVYNEGTSNAVKALDAVSLDFGAGEWCNIIGPNASGKSTLVRLIAGELKPSSGDMLYNNQSTSTWSQAQHARFFQYVEQDPEFNIVPSMTIAENLLLSLSGHRFLHLKSLFRGAWLAKVTECLKRFDMGLENRLTLQVGLLSGGQRQAIALAKAILCGAQVLLLDEFLASIDPKSAPRLLDIVRNYCKEKGAAVLMISHDLDHVVQAQGRVVLLSQGKVALDLAPKEPLTRDALVTYYSEAIKAGGQL